MTARRRAVFLDRDGVLTEPLVRDGRAYAPLSLDDFRLVEGAGEEVARLRASGPCASSSRTSRSWPGGCWAPAVLEEILILSHLESGL